MTPAYVYRAGSTLTLYRNGLAAAPKNAPKRIQKAVQAANKLVGKPYRMGGGHKRHHDRAYDCSGSVAFVLREAGLISSHKYLTSKDFLRWGRGGYGKWLTVYAKQGHVFLLIGGLRFDTTGSGRGVGPRWYATPRGCSGFYVRHIPGF
ncbi:MAG: peptidoglycan endopeptidase [Akkermansiaceae bacterium]|nr:peptidoglycan endopeptidase [Akkermansia sp.]MCD7798777.1 peptidoglycan endopeptidase [Akkermansiaceae bacterium]